MNTLVYTVAEIQAMLNISKELAYRFVGKAYQSQDPFIVLKIGTTYRIPKESFDRWITAAYPVAPIIPALIISHSS